MLVELNHFFFSDWLETSGLTPIELKGDFSPWTRPRSVSHVKSSARPAYGGKLTCSLCVMTKLELNTISHSLKQQNVK